jgi:hypothetical protein
MTPRQRVPAPVGWPAFVDYDPGSASNFDRVSALIVQAGYAAVSMLTGEPLPKLLMDKYLRRDRNCFDEVFELRPQQVDHVIEMSEPLKAAVTTQKALLLRALRPPLAGKEPKGLPKDMARWASEIVQRLKNQAHARGGQAIEDIDTGDFADVVDGVRTSGEFVQTTPELAFPVFISFGGLRLHFEGKMGYWAQSPSGLQLDIAPVIVDVFDFHFSTQDAPTGWMDHALARMQKSGEAHAFRIHGKGSSFRLIIHELGS